MDNMVSEIEGSLRYDHMYTVVFPRLPGFSVSGRNIKEVQKKCEERIHGYILDCINFTGKHPLLPESEGNRRMPGNEIGQIKLKLPQELDHYYRSAFKENPFDALILNRKTDFLFQKLQKTSSVSKPVFYDQGDKNKAN